MAQEQLLNLLYPERKELECYRVNYSLKERVAFSEELDNEFVNPNIICIVTTSHLIYKLFIFLFRTFSNKLF